MKLTEAKKQFISNWGGLGSHWGINRTMAQIHALLMISPEPLTQDEIMVELAISRGNVNMNIRDLIDWGLVERIAITGERKEYFNAEKDIWKVATQIIKERKKRELEPLINLLSQLENIEDDRKSKQAKQFLDIVSQIKEITQEADTLLNVMVKSKRNWFTSTVMKIFK